MGSNHIIVHKVKKSCMDIFVKTENCEECRGSET